MLAVPVADDADLGSIYVRTELTSCSHRFIAQCSCFVSRTFFSSWSNYSFIADPLSIVKGGRLARAVDLLLRRKKGNEAIPRTH